MALLLRHSSPIVRDVPSPLTERTSSPSQLRPRSNPRNRTPMRYTSPLHGAWIPEERPVGGITIRPTAGRAVGTVLAAGTAFRPTALAIAEGRRALATKSRKQGPSHRKVRRWNNDNFVNLAAEINSGNKGGRAAQALLVGQAHAEQFRSICDPEDHRSKAMTRLREDQTLRDVRDKFFEGELTVHPKCHEMQHGAPQRLEATTPEQMLLRIEARLRRVVIKACENSVPASNVVSQVEAFLLRAHRGKKVANDTDWWKDLFMEAPSITHRQRDNTYFTRYLFAGDSPNGGFHRLLLHGLCQFHGLKASSSTMEVAIDDTKPPLQARVLVATGTIAEATKKVRMVDHIMQRKQPNERESGTDPSMQNCGDVTLGASLQKLKV